MNQLFRKMFKSDAPYKVFFLSILLISLSYGLYKGVIDNFLAEAVQMGEFDKGVSEFFRELPGLMLVFILALFYTFSAEKLYKIGSVIMLVGMLMHAVVPTNKALVIIAICIYSLGDHIQLGMRTSLALEYSTEGRNGRALGWVSSMYRGGNLIGFIIVSIAFMFVSGLTAFRWTFALSSVILAAGMLLSFKLQGNTATDKSGNRFHFEKKYKKFYMLEIFYGARKQVFFTFGPYVLILFYGANTSMIGILFAVASICDFVAAPLVGRIIDKLGYKIVMVSDTLILVIVCFIYGFAHHFMPMNVAFIVCCVAYVLDSVISLASMASNVYARDLSDSPEEARAAISTGLSVNHLITIFIALFGGWIWHALGMETLFILSAILGLCNSAYAATIKSPKKKKEELKPAE